MTKLIPVLWFDKDGNGPSDLSLQLHAFDAENEIPASLGLRVFVNPHNALVYGPTIHMLGGGFKLEREQVAALYEELGQWLKTSSEANVLTLAPADTGGWRDDPATVPGHRLPTGGGAGAVVIGPLTPEELRSRLQDPNLRYTMASQEQIRNRALGPFVQQILAIVCELFDIQDVYCSDGTTLTGFFPDLDNQAECEKLYAEISKRLGIELDLNNEDDRMIVKIAERLKRQRMS